MIRASDYSASPGIDLNYASMTELQSLPGISREVAQAIVEYRSTNGQLASLEELADVPRVDGALVERLRPLVRPPQPSWLKGRIDLNHASVQELRQIPGLCERLAEAIAAYRKQHGPFHDLEELRQLKGFDGALLQSIEPHVHL